MKVHGGKELNTFQQHDFVAKKASPILAPANRSAATEKLQRTDPLDVLSNPHFSVTALISSAGLQDMTGHWKKPSSVAELSFNKKAFNADTSDTV